MGLFPFRQWGAAEGFCSEEGHELCAEASGEGDWWTEERRCLGGIRGTGTGGPGELGQLVREPEVVGESHPLAEGLQCAPAGWALCCRVKRMDSGFCSWTPASNASQPSELDNLCTLSRLQFPCLCNGSNNGTCCSGLSKEMN